MTETIIDDKDGLAARTITVQERYGDTFLVVRDTRDMEEIHTNLSFGKGEPKAKLAKALLGENATVVTDLPKVTRDYGFVTAGGYDRGENADPTELVRHAKALLAIAANITAHKAEQEATEAAEAKAKAKKEAQRNKRRDELAKEFGDGHYVKSYADASRTARNAIDHIIELEEAAKVS